MLPAEPEYWHDQTNAIICARAGVRCKEVIHLTSGLSRFCKGLPRGLMLEEPFLVIFRYSSELEESPQGQLGAVLTQRHSRNGHVLTKS